MWGCGHVTSVVLCSVVVRLMDSKCLKLQILALHGGMKRDIVKNERKLGKKMREIDEHQGWLRTMLQGYLTTKNPTRVCSRNTSLQEGHRDDRD
jgi:hypothetical protein